MSYNSWPLKMDRVDIEKVYSICDMVFILRQNLRFNNHCNSIVKIGYYNYFKIFV